MGLLRCILAITVVAAHSGPIFGYRFVGGVVAVQSFYIISGFYMSLILNEKYTGKGAYKLFITNRLLRLYPIYWAVAGLTVILSLVTAIDSGGGDFGCFEIYRIHSKEMKLSTIIFLIFSNIFIYFQDIIMFLRVDWSTGLLEFTKYYGDTKQPLYQFLIVPQAWTLGVELMFYAIAPFIVRKNKKFIFTLIFFSIVLRSVLMFGFGLKDDPWNYRFFPTEIVFFLFGNISYRIYNYLKNNTGYKFVAGGGGGLKKFI
ncbi:MAG: acyltransferase [Spirochaetaceae bacterium]|jgi:peptidoglycan/LPS O-acetylase OafA/YrhL|nr:acyltransferase [Spirochaetaceae bacterium]